MLELRSQLWLSRRAQSAIASFAAAHSTGVSPQFSVCKKFNASSTGTACRSLTQLDLCKRKGLVGLHRVLQGIGKSRWVLKKILKIVSRLVLVVSHQTLQSSGRHPVSRKMPRAWIQPSSSTGANTSLYTIYIYHTYM